MGDVLFSSTPWLQQDNLQEMGGGPGRIKLAHRAGRRWKGVIASISVQNLGLFVSAGSKRKRFTLQGEKERKRGREVLKPATFSIFPLVPAPRSLWSAQADRGPGAPSVLGQRRKRVRGRGASFLLLIASFLPHQLTNTFA